jgi:hypothetical protein
MGIVQNEPVLTATTGLVGAVIAVLVAFGIAFTGAQIAAILGLVVAVYTVAVLVRSQVTPVKKAPNA